MDRFASVVGRVPDIVQDFSGVGPRESLGRQEITLFESALKVYRSARRRLPDQQQGSLARVAWRWRCAGCCPAASA
jgi:hypothetical protein